MRPAEGQGATEEAKTRSWVWRESKTQSTNILPHHDEGRAWINMAEGVEQVFLIIQVANEHMKMLPRTKQSEIKSMISGQLA